MNNIKPLIIKLLESSILDEKMFTDYFTKKDLSSDLFKSVINQIIDKYNEVSPHNPLTLEGNIKEELISHDEKTGINVYKLSAEFNKPLSYNIIKILPKKLQLLFANNESLSDYDIYRAKNTSTRQGRHTKGWVAPKPIPNSKIKLNDEDLILREIFYFNNDKDTHFKDVVDNKLYIKTINCDIIIKNN